MLVWVLLLIVVTLLMMWCPRRRECYAWWQYAIAGVASILLVAVGWVLLVWGHHAEQRNKASSRSAALYRVISASYNDHVPYWEVVVLTQVRLPNLVFKLRLAISTFLCVFCLLLLLLLLLL